MLECDVNNLCGAYMIRNILTTGLDRRATSFVEYRLGQGRDKVVQFLRDYPAVCSEIEKVGAHFFVFFFFFKSKQALVVEFFEGNMMAKPCETLQAVRERIAEIMTAKRANGSAAVAYAGIDGDIDEDMLSEESLGELD